MSRSIIYAAAAVPVILVLLFVFAGRPLADLAGYFRAGASTTVKGLESNVPNVVHDEKAQIEIASARNQMVDRQVQLNLSENQLKQLESEIVDLRDAIDQRSTILAAAYPVLQDATQGQRQNITFVSTNFTLPEFQREIDDLLSAQQRDENTLAIKQQGFERLKESVSSGQSALASMKAEISQIEQEFAILKSRRDQAEMESDTLDLVAGATSDGWNTNTINGSVQRLDEQVQKLEARNAARREITGRPSKNQSGRLTQSFSRLDALRRYAQTKGDTSEPDEETDNKTDQQSLVTGEAEADTNQQDDPNTDIVAETTDVVIDNDSHHEANAAIGDKAPLFDTDEVVIRLRSKQ